MLQVMSGGHCMICHKDYTEASAAHPCFSSALNGMPIMPTACTPSCSKKYALSRDTIEGKLDYIIQLLERNPDA